MRAPRQKTTTKLALHTGGPRPILGVSIVVSTPSRVCAAGRPHPFTQRRLARVRRPNGRFATRQITATLYVVPADGGYILTAAVWSQY